MAARVPRIPGARFSEKKPPNFLKFIGPETPLWVLYPSGIMQMVFAEPLLARAVFARSIRVLEWQPGAPKIREHDFPKKNPVFFFNFIGPVTPLWVLQPSRNMHVVFTEILLARAVFTKSIQVFGWHAGARNSREHVFPKKNVLFLKFIGPVISLCVLYPPGILHMVPTECLLGFRRALQNFY